MSKTVISVRGVGKKYRLGATIRRDTLRDQIAHCFKSLFQQSSTKLSSYDSLMTKDQRFDSSDFWALRDISFDVSQGEVIGIIGRNGAGKSTILKILSEITEPTVGEILIRGRVGSLLEVGTGFHPELSGRENIYLNGAILGMSRAEIKTKFDAIVTFSGIGRFLDTPVKRYSSGMYVRLAFSVAAHLEPEILVVDEVLAVGDAEFQKKCVGKMNEVGSKGRTVIFVSHNLGVVSQLCKHCILLNNGKIQFEGDCNSVIRKYQSETHNTNDDVIDLSKAYRIGDGGAKIRNIRLYNSKKSLCRNFSIKDKIFFEFEAEYNDNPKNYIHAIHILNNLGVTIYDLCDANAKKVFYLNIFRIQRICVEVENINLIPGTYYINLWIGYKNGGGRADFVSNCISFYIEQVADNDIKAIKSNKGLIFKDAIWHFDVPKNN